MGNEKRYKQNTQRVLDFLFDNGPAGDQFAPVMSCHVWLSSWGKAFSGCWQVLPAEPRMRHPSKLFLAVGVWRTGSTMCCLASQLAGSPSTLPCLALVLTSLGEEDIRILPKTGG